MPNILDRWRLRRVLQQLAGGNPNENPDFLTPGWNPDAPHPLRQSQAPVQLPVGSPAAIPALPQQPVPWSVPDAPDTRLDSRSVPDDTTRFRISRVSAATPPAYTPSNASQIPGAPTYNIDTSEPSQIPGAPARPAPSLALSPAPTKLPPTVKDIALRNIAERKKSAYQTDPYGAARLDYVMDKRLINPQKGVMGFLKPMLAGAMTAMSEPGPAPRNGDQALGRLIGGATRGLLLNFMDKNAAMEMQYDAFHGPREMSRIARIQRETDRQIKQAHDLAGIAELEQRAKREQAQTSREGAQQTQIERRPYNVGGRGVVYDPNAPGGYRAVTPPQPHYQDVIDPADGKVYNRDITQEPYSKWEKYVRPVASRRLTETELDKIAQDELNDQGIDAETMARESTDAREGEIYAKLAPWVKEVLTTGQRTVTYTTAGKTATETRDARPEETRQADALYKAKYNEILKMNQAQSRKNVNAAKAKIKARLRQELGIEPAPTNATTSPRRGNTSTAPRNLDDALRLFEEAEKKRP